MIPAPWMRPPGGVERIVSLGTLPVDGHSAADLRPGVTRPAQRDLVRTGRMAHLWPTSLFVCGAHGSGARSAIQPAVLVAAGNLGAVPRSSRTLPAAASSSTRRDGDHGPRSEETTRSATSSSTRLGGGERLPGDGIEVFEADRDPAELGRVARRETLVGTVVGRGDRVLLVGPHPRVHRARVAVVAVCAVVAHGCGRDMPRRAPARTALAAASASAASSTPRSAASVTHAIISRGGWTGSRHPAALPAVDGADQVAQPERAAPPRAAGRSGQRPLGPAASG